LTLIVGPRARGSEASIWKLYDLLDVTGLRGGCAGLFLFCQ
jgi:hypothetical protein